MALFSFKAQNPNGKLVQGTLSAASQTEVADMLKREGLLPININEEKSSAAKAKKLPDQEKINFCRYMSTMITSGISLSEGVNVLKEQTKHKVMRGILDDIAYNLERGKNLSFTFELYPKIFNPFFVSLIKAGEVSGTLAQTFKYLEEQIKAEANLKGEIKSAMMYPSIVISALLGIGMLMMFFILPQIGKVFLSMSIELPSFTRAMFEFSTTIAQYRIIIMSMVPITIISLVVILKTKKGKMAFLRLIGLVPIIRQLMKSIDIARFTRIFGVLLSSAVPITEAVQIAIATLNYPEFVKKSDPLPEEITQGKTLAEAFKKHKVFPSLITQMIASGEKSGTLDIALKDIAEFYEGEVKDTVKQSTQLLEPILMLVVGIGVGAMILSIIAPLYSVVGSLQGGGF